jgi:hypothetical protein
MLKPDLPKRLAALREKGSLKISFRFEKNLTVSSAEVKTQQIHFSLVSRGLNVPLGDARNPSPSGEEPGDDVDEVDESKRFIGDLFHRSLTVAALWTVPKQSRARKQAAGNDPA